MTDDGLIAEIEAHIPGKPSVTLGRYARNAIPALTAALRAERVHKSEVELARIIIKRADEHTDEMERLRTRLAEATALINAAVELMTTEQAGKWTGVRAWLEMEE